jgi:hypothetical protein
MSQDDSTREPWTCDSCGLFVYNLDENGKPAPGAPSPYFGGEYSGRRYEQVCTACFQMKDALSSDYWRSIQNTADTIRKQRMDKFKASGGGLA